MPNKPPEWTTRAFCKSADPQIFDGEDSLYDETAKGFCARCPVRTECRAFALDPANRVTGIWGGLTESERNSSRRGGKRATCPGCRGQMLFSDGVNQICLLCGITWRL